MNNYQIIHNSCRTARSKHIVAARDMAEAIRLDAPRRKRLGIFKFVVRKV